MGKLLTLVVAVLLIGGGWYYWQNRAVPENTGGAAGTYEEGSENAGTSDTPDISAPAATLSKVVINMTDTGFEPSAVTVKKGQTVEFVNTGKETHWPASDLHPTHEIYPEFDADKPVKPGESYSFVFEKVGKWNMHDHLHARFRGSIEVTE